MSVGNVKRPSGEKHPRDGRQDGTGVQIRYTTIQNWSNNVYNLVTKRAVTYEGATVEWVDGNLGSKVTIKYPSVYLLG